MATLKEEAVFTYADIVFASYGDSYQTALALQTAVHRSAAAQYG